MESETENERIEQERAKEREGGGGERKRGRVWPVPASLPWWSRDQYSLPPLPWLTPPARYGCPLPRENPPSATHTHILPPPFRENPAETPETPLAPSS